MAKPCALCGCPPGTDVLKASMGVRNTADTLYGALFFGNHGTAQLALIKLDEYLASVRAYLEPQGGGEHAGGTAPDTVRMADD